MGIRGIRRLKKELNYQRDLEHKLFVIQCVNGGRFFDYWAQKLKCDQLQTELDNAYKEYYERRNVSHETY